MKVAGEREKERKEWQMKSSLIIERVVSSCCREREERKGKNEKEERKRERERERERDQ